MKRWTRRSEESTRTGSATDICVSKARSRRQKQENGSGPQRREELKVIQAGCGGALFTGHSHTEYWDSAWKVLKSYHCKATITKYLQQSRQSVFFFSSRKRNTLSCEARNNKSGSFICDLMSKIWKWHPLKKSSIHTCVYSYTISIDLSNMY